MGDGKKNGDPHFLTEREIAAQRSMQYRVPTVDLDQHAIEPAVIALVSKRTCEKHCVVPVSRAANALIVAMTDPTDAQVIGDLKYETGHAIEPVIATESAIRSAILRYYGA